MFELNEKNYAKAARQAVAEGCVLLKNEGGVLPLVKGTKTAVFGIGAFYYYKGGLGSGGLVNTKYVVSILDALRKSEDISVDECICEEYEKWIKEKPFDEGNGWGSVPWSQKEMPLSEEFICEAEKRNDVAIVIIGRTAGEDQDNRADEGSYYLTQTERELIKNVTETFEKSVVLLNVGNIIDMKWVDEYKPSAVMYVWQGGQEGGNGVLDVLDGTVSPSGKLTDTIAYNIEDYPSASYFGDADKNYYVEDIYVGYKYFQTVAADKVMYPFGFGMSYTDFEISGSVKNVDENSVVVDTAVKNTGDCEGKEVVQVYIEAPQGKLGKPVRTFAGYAKTKELAANESEKISISCPKSYFASYDDAGITGHKSAFVLEGGEYKVYVGNSVAKAQYIGSFSQEFQVIEQLEEALAPVEQFERMHPVLGNNEEEVLENADAEKYQTKFDISENNEEQALKNGNENIETQFTEKNQETLACKNQKNSCEYSMGFEKVPLRTISLSDRIESEIPEDILFTGDEGYSLKDVANGKIDIDTFIGQLSDEDLMCLMRGEGMCSMKVTPGTAAAFGGLTPSLERFGIPALCCADGPSGIRMDCGTKAFLLPIGTLLGATFNDELIEELFEYFGAEMKYNRIDTILGPGMNIHRHPLNGRNYEYISEDTILTGKICAAELKGLHRVGVEGTIKHFCANNQEFRRADAMGVISERALREIYLKCFEIAIKETGCSSVMTTYGPFNGLWTSGNYDLCTTVLRKEWGFDGIVMTDWWAVANWEGEKQDRKNRAAMVQAQNDIFMVCPDTENENAIDNIKAQYTIGNITRGQLQRNAKNVLKFALRSLAMQIKLGKIDLAEYAPEWDTSFRPDGELEIIIAKGSHIEVSAELAEKVLYDDGIYFNIADTMAGDYSAVINITSQHNEYTQIPISVFIDNDYRGTITFQGTNGKEDENEISIGKLGEGEHYVRVAYRPHGITMNKIVIKKND